MASRGEMRIGIAGWVYEDWRGSFYPAGTTQKNELAYASSKLRVIEINSTFYANQKPTSFQNWAMQTPGSFVFSVKGPKFITEQKKLRDVAEPLANFFASGPLALGAKLGPFVWQLPKGFKFDAQRVGDFLALLPHTPDEAATLAGKHDDRLKAPAFNGTDGVTKVRHAIEARDESFANAEFIALLRQYNVALVTADTALWPYRDVTADFVYARLQGPADGGSYDKGGLDAWAAQILGWAEGKAGGEGPFIASQAEDKPRDVFAFFVHADKVHAPDNAQAIMARIDIAPPG